MIPGGGAIGQYPNLSLGLPVSGSARTCQIKIGPTKQANVRILPRKEVRLAKYPKQ